MPRTEDTTDGYDEWIRTGVATVAVGDAATDELLMLLLLLSCPADETTNRNRNDGPCLRTLCLGS